MSRIVVTGPTRSGKSRIAEHLADSAGTETVVFATGRIEDAEMAERVRGHRRRRPDAWRTIETADLEGAFEDVPSDAPVLVDALDTWLAVRMGAHGLWTDEPVAPLGEAGQAAADRIIGELTRFWSAAARRPGTTVVVAGQPGWSPTPADASTRRYVDLHGRALQLLAVSADRVLLAVAGRTVELTTGAPAIPPGLREHGDRQVPAGTLDLAVNVLDTPAWLRNRLGATLDRAAIYPDDAPARRTAASRHGRPPAECLVLDGAAEAFWLLAAALRPRLAACVHPSFTAPEAALRAHGHPVVRVHRDPDRDWRLDPAAIPEQADLVVVGRPDNPTGVLDPVDRIAALCRPGRTLVVDEAFAEFLGDAGGLADRRDLPGLVVVRSLTKIWGLAGVRVGYLLAGTRLVTQLDVRRQPWPVNALACDALIACLEAEAQRLARVRSVGRERERLVSALETLPGLQVWDAAANFVLLRAPDRCDLRERLLDRGIAVRRGDTFPGLGPDHVRVAVRDEASTDRLVEALHAELSPVSTAQEPR